MSLYTPTGMNTSGQFVITSPSDIATNAPVIGNYSIATLPPAADNAGKYAFVTDLGGGPDMCISDGIYWKHIRLGTPTPVSGTSINITPLASPPLVVLTGSINVAAMVTLQLSNIYPGYQLSVNVPTGVLGLLGSLGVKLAGGPAIAQLGNTWADYIFDGTNLIKFRSATVP